MSWRTGGLLAVLGLVVGFSAAQQLLLPAVLQSPEIPLVLPGPVQLPPRDFTVDFFGLTYSGSTSELIDRTVLKRGAFEKHVLFFMADLLQAFDHAEPVYVDVGANTGQHVLFMAPRVAQVHAFEPYPPVVEKLRAQIERNRLTNVTVHAVGLGAAASTLVFQEPAEGNNGTGGFTRPEKRDESPHTMLLQVVRGDDVLAKAGTVTVIKIDVEGYERPVLEGLRGTVTANRPVLIIEITPHSVDSFTSPKALLEVLPERYSLRHLQDPVGRESGRYQLLERLPFETPSHFEVVAYPTELEARIPQTNQEQDPYTQMQRYTCPRGISQSRSELETAQTRDRSQRVSPEQDLGQGG
ncbi:MAG: FkbM family methyltransferase [Pseudomonadota bacterium]